MMTLNLRVGFPHCQPYQEVYRQYTHWHLYRGIYRYNKGNSTLHLCKK